MCNLFIDNFRGELLSVPVALVLRYKNQKYKVYHAAFTRRSRSYLTLTSLKSTRFYCNVFNSGANVVVLYLTFLRGSVCNTKMSVVSCSFFVQMVKCVHHHHQVTKTPNYTHARPHGVTNVTLAPTSV